MKASLGIWAFGNMATRFNPAGYKPELGSGLYPSTGDAVGAVARSVHQWRFSDGVAARIDDAALRAAQREKDAVRAELVDAALGA